MSPFLFGAIVFTLAWVCILVLGVETFRLA